MKLPNAENAIIPEKNLREYCLNSEHAHGQHKAFLFSKLLGITDDNIYILRDMLETALSENEIIRIQPTDHGTIYYIDSLIVKGERSFILRSLWIILFGEIIPRFVSCYIRRKGSKMQ